MRITDKILQNNFISNLNFSSERLFEAEIKVLTHKRVNKPSDNPVDAMNSLSIRKKLSELEQYQRNIGRSIAVAQNTESIITQLADIFQRLTALTVQGASDSYGPSDKLSIASEVNQLLEQIANFGNNRSESIYIFGGTNNDVAPYQIERDAAGDIIDVKTTGSSGDIKSLVGEKIKIKVNINGEDLFEAGVNLFDVVKDVRDNLRNNATDALRANLGDINNASEKIYNTQAMLGSRLNRINSAQSRAESDIISFTEYLSETEDADSALAIMDYQMELLTLQASLQAGARLLYPKLMDFLR